MQSALMCINSIEQCIFKKEMYYHIRQFRLASSISQCVATITLLSFFLVLYSDVMQYNLALMAVKGYWQWLFMVSTSETTFNSDKGDVNCVVVSFMDVHEYNYYDQAQVNTISSTLVQTATLAEVRGYINTCY